ncbi:hypothetical protein [Caballeronia sp. DA-9]|uniref:hypothetical protein n=1 Tax=Caballeronia sp. DA-9 TaxID=3436237 RepID=UPI003F6694E2
MIIDIPTGIEFRSIGVALLNNAWDTATSLLIEIDDADYYDVDTDEIKEAYWGAARIQLSTALSVAQQGSEFLLKAKIVEVSPYLLLAAQPRDWPKGCAATDTAFSEFRTIDAQDLVKVHNTIRTDKITETFIQRFEHLRKQRNAIMHSIDKKLSVHVSDLMLAVLQINAALGLEKNWARVRHDYLKTAPLSQMHSEDWADYRLVREFSIVVDLLKADALEEYFLFNRKQRHYICPNCSYSLASDDNIELRTALLAPNTSESTSIWCFVCGSTEDVERKACADSGCKGNVYSEQWGRCLTCGS